MESTEDVDFKPQKRKLPHSDVRSLVSESTLSSFAHAAIESGRNDKDDGASVQHQITSIEFSPSKKSAKQRKLKNINLGLEENWDAMIAMQWEGHKDSCNIDPDIHSYSDEMNSSPEIYGDARTAHGDFQCDIYTTEELRSSSLVFDRSRRTGGTRSRALQLPTLSPDHSEVSQNDNIEDFDSPSGSADDTSFPLHLTLIRPSKKIPVPFRSSTLADDTSISTPPSSPEMESDVSKLRASDWIKQVHLDSVDSLSKSCELPDVSDVMKTPVDSAKKKHGRKLIAGGLAERLLRIVQREKSEITFWEHKVKKLREAKSDLSSSLTIQVVSFSNCCSLVVCKCRVLNSKVECSKVECSQQEQREEIEDTKMMTVIFSPCRAKFVGISVGCHIQIHSPWCSFDTSSGEVILCPHFCQRVGFSPLPTPKAATPTVDSHLKADLSSSCGLSRTPVKGLVPTRLFPDNVNLSQQESKHENEETEESDKNRDPTCVSMDAMPVPINLLDAVNRASVGVISALTATVVRVCRRAGSTVNCVCGSSKESFSTSMLLDCAKKARPSRHKWRWSLLVRDNVGDYAEIKMPYLTARENPMWSILVLNGEGNQCYFSKLRVNRKLEVYREPAVFSVMSSIESSRAYKDHVSAECDVSVPSSLARARVQSCPPVCFILEWQEDTYFQLCECDDGKVRNGEKNNIGRTGWTCGGLIRINLVARVVTLQQEIPSHHVASDSGLVLPICCGHYLFVVSSTHLLNSTLSTEKVVGGDNWEPLLIRIYIKQAFVDKNLLNSSGSAVYLRDVVLQYAGTSEAAYFMDSYSFVFPFDRSDLKNVMYPILDTIDWSGIHHLTLPKLPALSEAELLKVPVLVSVSGCIIDLDSERTYSYSSCSTCGSVELRPSKSGEPLYCEVCEKPIHFPVSHKNFTVHMHCSNMDSCRVSLELLESTAEKLFPSRVSTDKDFNSSQFGMRIDDLSCCLMSSGEVLGDMKRSVLLKEVNIPFMNCHV